MLQASDLEKSVSKANGKRRTRVLNQGDVDRFVELVNENANNPQIRTIRVYSSQGFVPNSYKYRADISCLEATRQENGEFKCGALTVNAKRPHGSGALVTINGRSTDL